MLLSARQAAARLETIGIGRRQARRVLAAGLAGVPMVTPHTHLFDADRVDALLGWPRVEEEAVRAACPWGIFVARRPPADALSGWDLSMGTLVWIRVLVDRHGFLPFVATVGGFVALGGEVTRVLSNSDHTSTLELREPGEWYATLRAHRYATGPGKDWMLRGLPFSSVGGWKP